MGMDITRIILCMPSLPENSFKLLDAVTGMEAGTIKEPLSLTVQGELSPKLHYCSLGAHIRLLHGVHIPLNPEVCL